MPETPLTTDDYTKTAHDWNVRDGLQPGFLAYVCASTRDELGAAIDKLLSAAWRFDKAVSAASSARNAMSIAIEELDTIHSRLHELVDPRDDDAADEPETIDA